jgi:hypothetical protein
MNRIEPKRLTSIDDDFALWATEQGGLLRAHKFDRLDLENVAEELESLWRSDRYEIAHRLEPLLAHLLKWQFQPGMRTNSWRSTILEQRTRIADLIEASPSLKAHPAKVLTGAYVLGRNTAITETQLPESSFPEACPYSIGQILDPDFLPD